MVTRSMNSLRKESIIQDKKTNWKNKKLMNDKILSYSPPLIEGINKYKDANIKFTFLILLSALCVSVPMISFVICSAAIVYLIKMFKLIKFRNINNIVNVLSRDLTFKGIYDKGKTKAFLDDFIEKYGEDNIEYNLLIEMLDKYECLVMKIEAAIKKINLPINEKNEYAAALDEPKKQSVKENNVKEKVKTCCKSINNKIPLTYKNEKGEIKKINRVIEFFQDKENSIDENNTVILEGNKKGKDSRLTIYLHKKTCDL